MSMFDVKLLRGAKLGLMVAGLGGLLASCGTTTPLDTYSLSAPRPAVTAKSRKSVQLLVAAPTALKALDSENIVVNPASGSIAYLSGAQWGDRLPNIIQSRLVQSYENTGLLGGVGRPGDGLAINYQVLTDVREFGIHASTSPQTAVVELAVKLMDDKNGNVRATRVFRNVVAVQGSGNAAYLKALDQAFEKTAAEIVSWTFSAM
ncbi:ABC-type transport auxiliary lipoprotein family protein [Paenochrobactrum glaciei]|uniref:ABC-type transport auxiliary lipoprotein family protein n=2 Tax=Paenochrobactrum glaciei TaxID=486407 RepID=A0ABN1G2Z5_9HYPH